MKESSKTTSTMVRVRTPSQTAPLTEVTFKRTGKKQAFFLTLTEPSLSEVSVWVMASSDVFHACFSGWKGKVLSLTHRGWFGRDSFAAKQHWACQCSTT